MIDIEMSLHSFLSFYCRCESFNGMIRAQNVYSNKLSPSRDIAHSFAVLGHLRYIISGGRFGPNGQWFVLEHDKLNIKTRYELSDFFL